MLGIMLGANLVMLAVMSGLAAVLSAPGLRLVLLAGSTAFLFYLAARIAFAGTKIAFIEASTRPACSRGGAAGAEPQGLCRQHGAVHRLQLRARGAVVRIGKLVIANLVWSPLPVLWLWAGVRLHALELSERWQRVINLGMAAALVAVAVLSAVTLLFA